MAKKRWVKSSTSKSEDGETKQEDANGSPSSGKHSFGSVKADHKKTMKKMYRGK